MQARYELELAGRPLIIETGELAQQAGGAVTVRYGDTMVLGTATATAPRRGLDFFPLTVEYEERLYAAGRIPGSFFRREGRPTTGAVLSARLTDRPLRPLFPKGYMDDTQIVLTILSVDLENAPDTLGTIAASAALSISDIPFGGPVGSVRVGYADGELVLQPTYTQLGSAENRLDLVVAGTKDGIMMVEAEANDVPEAVLVDAIRMGQAAVEQIVALQEQMRAKHGRPKRDYTPELVDPGARDRVQGTVGDQLAAALSPDSGHSKAERDERLAELRTRALDGVSEEEQDAAAGAFADLERTIVRRNILEQGARPDGRTPTQLRPLQAQVGLIPRTHGSALFQRGETQVLSLTTLAGTGLVQRLDDLGPAETKRFMHHYNFPPFSTGETGRMGTGRREIGHGMLGERAMTAVLPDEEDFPYTIRIVAEVLSSNGSTSMASVCASVLSLMDAGVPIKAPVAGIAMGLMKGERDDEFQVLTDIAGLEDHLGDMDFKVAGTRDGVTALQMDIKVSGITPAIMSQALSQARDARMQILDVMLATLDKPRDEMSPYAPRMHRIDIPTEKIGAVIGPGGRTIRQLEEESGASIDIQKDGTVYVSATDQATARKALDAIKALTKDVEVGETYTGKVTRLMKFGAFVEILPGKDALVHISDLADYRVASVEDVAQVGDEMKVVVTEIDNLGRVNASRRALLSGDGASAREPPPAERRPEPRPERRPERRPEARRSDAGPGTVRSDLDLDSDSDSDSGSGSRPGPEREREEGAVGAVGGNSEGAPRRRRRRRRRASGGDSDERQPESHAVRAAENRSVLGRSRQQPAPEGEPLPPPPPPRRDFGAPAQ